MKYNFKSLLYSLLAVGVFSAIGCSKPSKIGLSLVEQEKTDIVTTDSTSIWLTTEEATPTETQARPQMVCGAYDDPFWGSSIASIYMNFRLNNTGATFPNAIFDSLVLTMAYESFGHYGELEATKPTTSPQSWDVVRLTEDIVEGTTYKSDVTFTTGDVLKSGFIFNPNDTALIPAGAGDPVAHLRIKLDDPLGITLGETFLNPQGVNADLYNSNLDFKNIFKGLHVRPTPGYPNNSIVRFKSQDNLTKLTLYYTDMSSGTGVQRTFEFLRNEDAEVVSTFEHTHPTALTDNTVTDTVVYLQGLDGLHTKIEFPYVADYGDIIVNKAELVVHIADTGTAEYPEPFQLVAKVKDINGNLVVIDDIATSLIRTGTYLLFGGVREQVTGGNTFLYRMQLAEEMQAIINGTTFERAIYLTTPSALDPERTTLINHQGINKAKLYLTYTKLQ